MLARYLCCGYCYIKLFCGCFAYVILCLRLLVDSQCLLVFWIVGFRLDLLGFVRELGVVIVDVWLLLLVRVCFDISFGFVL